VTVCVFVGRNEFPLHAYIYRHACGWLVCFVPAVPSRGTGTLFDLKSIIVHLNLACVLTNCGDHLSALNIVKYAFCVHLKAAEQNKKKTNI